MSRKFAAKIVAEGVRYGVEDRIRQPARFALVEVDPDFPETALKLADGLFKRMNEPGPCCLCRLAFVRQVAGTISADEEDGTLSQPAPQVPE